MSGWQEWGSCYGGQMGERCTWKCWVQRKRDRCLLLLIWKARVGHIYNPKTEQTPSGVTVRFQGQPTSSMQECTTRTSSSYKYWSKKFIYAKTAYVVNNRLFSIIFSDPFWLLDVSLSSDVWSKWRQDCHCRSLWSLADIKMSKCPCLEWLIRM